MRAVSVDGTEHDIVLEHDASVEPTDIDGKRASRGRYTDETGDCPARVRGHHIEHDAVRAGALDDDVGWQAIEKLGQVLRVVIGTERLHERGFGPVLGLVEDVDVESFLAPDERRKQPDRASAGNDDMTGRPVSAMANAFDLLPGFGHDTRGFEQYAKRSEPV